MRNLIVLMFALLFIGSSSIANAETHERAIGVSDSLVIFPLQYIDDVFMSPTYDEKYDVVIYLTADGTKKFLDITKENIGKSLSFGDNDGNLPTPVIRDAMQGPKVVAFHGATESKARGYVTILKLKKTNESK